MAKQNAKRGTGHRAVPRTTKRAPKETPKDYDPALSSLFASSLGPVKGLPTAAEIATVIEEAHSTEDELTPGEKDINTSNDLTNSAQISDRINGQMKVASRKRKRREEEDNLEGKYMRRLAREEAREDSERRNGKSSKRQRQSDQVGSAEVDGATGGKLTISDSAKNTTVEEKQDQVADIPAHESLVPPKDDSDLEKASRTVFLANVCTSTIKSKTAKKTLLDHLASFLPFIAPGDTAHKVESLRFRSTAFASSGVPKKAAYAKKELMDSTTKSTNAYAVYTTQLAAREATKKLNGTIILERHLRVDSVAHPAKQDHRRCVFVGNLGFVDDPSMINAAEDEEKNKRPRKTKEPADVEEGLWRQFGKAGTLESVRVVRDKTTRVGKGFAYVQFQDANTVEKALLYNEKKFPPMLPRTLRVTRAKDIRKTASNKNQGKRLSKDGASDTAVGAYAPKLSSQVQSLSGRAGKLLGRAGAAQFRGVGDSSGTLGKKFDGIAKTPEPIIFEGYRASSKQGKGTMKMGGRVKKQGKPGARSTAFRATGGKKGKARTPA